MPYKKNRLVKEELRSLVKFMCLQSRGQLPDERPPVATGLTGTESMFLNINASQSVPVRRLALILSWEAEYELGISCIHNSSYSFTITKSR